MGDGKRQKGALQTASLDELSAILSPQDTEADKQIAAALTAQAELHKDQVIAEKKEAVSKRLQRLVSMKSAMSEEMCADVDAMLAQEVADLKAQMGAGA